MIFERLASILCSRAELQRRASAAHSALAARAPRSHSFARRCSSCQRSPLLPAKGPRILAWICDANSFANLPPSRAVLSSPGTSRPPTLCPPKHQPPAKTPAAVRCKAYTACGCAAAGKATARAAAAGCCRCPGRLKRPGWQSRRCRSAGRQRRGRRGRCSEGDEALRRGGAAQWRRRRLKHAASGMPSRCRRPMRPRGWVGGRAGSAPGAAPLFPPAQPRRRAAAPPLPQGRAPWP
jgi:hypothetical protein